MRHNVRRAAVVAAVALLAAAAVVRAGETDRGGYDLELSTRSPGALTGLGFHVLYKDPSDPEGKPPSITAATFELPRGMVIDSGALPRCTASDEDFRAEGRDACPAETRVGDGKLTAMTGFPGADPVTADVVVFNGEAELIEVVFAEGTNAVAGMDRLAIEDGRLVAHPPATPGGPPDGRTAVREIRLSLPARAGEGGRPYVVTPPDCPTGTWTSVARYEFADGGKTVVTSKSPCAAGAAPAPSLDVAVTPRRVRRGTRRRFSVTVTSGDPACIRNALVRLGNDRGRTDARGRAKLVARFRHRGVKRVRASRRGCGSARATVRVR